MLECEDVLVKLKWSCLINQKCFLFTARCSCSANSATDPFATPNMENVQADMSLWKSFEVYLIYVKRFWKLTLWHSTHEKTLMRVWDLPELTDSFLFILLFRGHPKFRPIFCFWPEATFASQYAGQVHVVKRLLLFICWCSTLQTSEATDDCWNCGRTVESIWRVRFIPDKDVKKPQYWYCSHMTLDTGKRKHTS